MMGRLSQAVSDDPFRRAAFQAEIHPLAKAIHKSKGVTYGEAIKELLSDPKTVDSLTQKVFDDLVDFNNLNQAERDVVRRYFNPFWSWTKGSSKIAAIIATEKPELAWLLNQIGQSGERKFDHTLPEFVQGLIPVHGKWNISAQAFNPIQTPADTLQQLLGVVKPGKSVEYGPENVLTGMNPVIKSAISAFTGTDPFSGYAVPGSSPIERFTGSFVGEAWHW
jgi:hypothetical protein